MRCRLCGEQTTSEFFSRTWNDPHYKAHHGEYSRWLRSWTRNFVIVGIIDVAILSVVLYILNKIGTGAIAIEPLLPALLLYLVPLWILMLRYFQKVGFFKRQWSEQHPLQPPAMNGPLGRGGREFLSQQVVSIDYVSIYDGHV